MSLTQEQIKKLSEDLAKIRSTDPKIAEDVNNIIGYIDLLDEVDTTGIEATVSVVHQANVLREDVETAKNSTPQDLLTCSKQKIIAKQIAVTNIMK